MVDPFQPGKDFHLRTTINWLIEDKTFQVCCDERYTINMSKTVTPVLIMGDFRRHNLFVPNKVLLQVMLVR